MNLETPCFNSNNYFGHGHNEEWNVMHFLDHTIIIIILSNKFLKFHIANLINFFNQHILEDNMNFKMDVIRGFYYLYVPNIEGSSLVFMLTPFKFTCVLFSIQTPQKDWSCQCGLHFAHCTWNNILIRVVVAS